MCGLSFNNLPFIERQSLLCWTSDTIYDVKSHDKSGGPLICNGYQYGIHNFDYNYTKHKNGMEGFGVRFVRVFLNRYLDWICRGTNSLNGNKFCTKAKSGMPSYHSKKKKVSTIYCSISVVQYFIKKNKQLLNRLLTQTYTHSYFSRTVWRSIPSKVWHAKVAFNSVYYIIKLDIWSILKTK